MKTKILKTEEEYNEACERVYLLMNSSEYAIEPNTSEGEEMELLSLLIEKYEQENFQMKAPSPIEAIKFRMEQMNLKQADVAPIFGGTTRVSEVLNGRRALTLKMITLLNRYLGIPLESLISGNEEIKLEPENREKLLHVSSIKEYLNSGRAVVFYNKEYESGY
jgi:HTH-type transcriptional regulator / antitoxin HigA